MVLKFGGLHFTRKIEIGEYDIATRSRRKRRRVQAKNINNAEFIQ